jgi:glycosyltransferase involved in cell wall biosynthesis
MEQSHVSYEVVVVDDCSPGEAGAAIERVVAAYPGVRYIRIPSNRGIIGARNFGNTQCRGEFIVNLDDDSWFLDKDALKTVETVFRGDASIGIIAFNIFLKERGCLWDQSEAQFDNHLYHGCGNAYRVEALKRVGPCIEEFSRQGEEQEHSIRFMDAGYKVVVFPHVVVFHDLSPLNRISTRTETYEILNKIRRELALAPILFLPLSLGLALYHIVPKRRLVDWPLFWNEAMRGRGSFWAVLTKLRHPVSYRTFLHFSKLKIRSRRRLNAYHDRLESQRLLGTATERPPC